MKQILFRLVLCVTAVVPFLKGLGLGGVEGNNNAEWYDLLAEKKSQPSLFIFEFCQSEKRGGLAVLRIKTV